MDDCIEILEDDDDEVEIIDIIVNLEPKHKIIDLTDSEDAASQGGDEAGQSRDGQDEQMDEDNENEGQNTEQSFGPIPSFPAEPSPTPPSDQSMSPPSPPPEPSPPPPPEPSTAQSPEPSPTQPPQPSPAQPPEPSPAQPQEPSPTLPQEPSPSQPQETPPTQRPETSLVTSSTELASFQTHEQSAIPPGISQVIPVQSQVPPAINSVQPGPIDKHKLMMDQKSLGNEKYKRNLFDDAIRIYKRANELAEELGEQEMSAIIHFNLAMTYYKLGSFKQAADECAYAVKLNDNYIKAHLKRAEIYQRQCKFEEAVICYEHICKLDSGNPDYILLLNNAREAAKRLKKQDHYHLLGVGYNYTEEELRKAYRKKALIHHPDRHSNADVVTRRIEEKYFKEMSEAYHQLKALQTRYSLWRH